MSRYNSGVQCTLCTCCLGNHPFCQTSTCILICWPVAQSCHISLVNVMPTRTGLECYCCRVCTWSFPYVSGPQTLDISELLPYFCSLYTVCDIWVATSSTFSRLRDSTDRIRTILRRHLLSANLEDTWIYDTQPLHQPTSCIYRHSVCFRICWFLGINGNFTTFAEFWCVWHE